MQYTMRLARRSVILFNSLLPMQAKTRQRPFFLLALVAILLLSSCSSEAQEMVGMRPASHLPAVVEAYLQRYQPGPLPRLFQTTYVYDRNGVQIAELFEEGRRTWVSMDRISPHLLDATVATEDVTFYTNLGIDPFRIAAAAWANTAEGRIISGASTISMQLARNLFLGPDQRYDASMDRKLLEAGLAQELTALYTKDEILEMYLNLLNYGNLAYGPEAAALVYFGKHASELNRAEATFLAGIPQQPATLDPFRNFAAVKERQSVVLELMVRHGFLSKREADAIFREPLDLKPRLETAPNLAPHFVQYLIQELDARLGPGYTERAGFNLFATLDLRMQRLAEKMVAERIAQGRQRYNMNNAALVAMRPGTAEVLVMVGSVNFNDPSIGGQVNVALMPRQPGSAIKPLLYATAFDDLLLSPASAMWDLPVSYDLGGNQFYRPQNYDNKFHGLVTARTALANSYNVPAVRLLDTMGIERALAGAEALGVRSLTDDPRRYTLTLALGGHELTLMDLMIGYHTIANNGRYIPPQVAQTFLNSQSQLIHPLAEPEPIQAIDEGAAFLVTDILSDNAARSAAFGTNSPLRLTIPAAVKTGTTTSFRDNWTIGYSKYLLVGVWVGNSNGQPMKNTTGVTGAAPIWRDFMEEVVKTPEFLKTLDVPVDDPDAWAFTPPADVALRTECPLNLTCRKDGEYFTRAWLTAAGADGPLADMFVTAATVPVHADRAGNAWGPVYCSQPGGQERTLFRLADIHGLAGVGQRAQGQRNAGLASASPSTNESVSNKSNLQQEATDRAVIFYYPDKELERMRRIQWARNQGMAINVGDCSTLDYYTVQNGEHWTMLARRFNLTVGELQAANPHVMRGDGVLRPGDRLLTPNGIPVEVGGLGEFYTVQSGDTWGQIAQRFGLPLRFLQTINPQVVRPFFLLKPGDQIFVPRDEQLEGVLQ
jgi:penicillin-binding protein 1C